MILLETSSNLYYNTQLYFRKNMLESLANDDREWAEAYARWLATQGAVLIKDNNKSLLRNGLGVAPGYDKFGFTNPADATVFLLRWSS